jgi:hypothetical protein
MSQVFFSWSGDLARQIADVFAKWIPAILQTVKPFYSPEIEKGTRWGVEIATALENCTSGLVFATPDNLRSQWLNFEAGAISKLGGSRVYVLIFGLKKSDLTGPLAQFQASDFTMDEIQNVLNSINENGEKIESVTWQRAFDAIWPKIKEEVNVLIELAKKKSEEPTPDPRSAESMLEELLLIARRIDAGTSVDKSTPSSFMTHDLNTEALSQEMIMSINSGEFALEFRKILNNLRYDNQISELELRWITRIKPIKWTISSDRKNIRIDMESSSAFFGTRVRLDHIEYLCETGMHDKYMGHIGFDVRITASDFLLDDENESDGESGAFE